MTLNILISWRDIDLWFLPGNKCRANVLHILAHGVLPKFITILTVELNFLIHILWDLYPKLVSLQPILVFHIRNYTITLLQIIRYPPS